MGCEFVLGGVLLIGDLRDIGATISGGDWIGTGLNLAALIPAYGDAAKAAASVGKFITKHPELAKPAVLLLAGVTRYSDETEEALAVLKASYGDEAINAIRANGATDSTLSQLYAKNVNLFNVRKLLDNVYSGAWATSGRKTAEENFEKHYKKHVLDQNEWGYDIGRDLYRQKAVNHINKRDGTVELYYQQSMDNILIYNRGTKEIGFATPYSKIQTYFIEATPQNPNQLSFVDNLIDTDNVVRLN